MTGQQYTCTTCGARFVIIWKLVAARTTAQYNAKRSVYYDVSRCPNCGGYDEINKVVDMKTTTYDLITQEEQE